MRGILILGLSLLVLAVVGCNGEEPLPAPSQDRSAASNEAADSAKRARDVTTQPQAPPKEQPKTKPNSGDTPGSSEEAAKELKRIPPPWVIDPPPKGQKPIYGLPLDIRIDAPPVPEKIARPAPPLPK